MDAIHPGYGFLSEREGFANACKENGITFIGPTVAQLNTFGDKTKARELAIKVRGCVFNACCEEACSVY